MIDVDSYLTAKKNLELSLLDGTVHYNNRSVYCTQRDIIAGLAYPFVHSFLKRNRQPMILEIGCGVGNALFKLLDDHKHTDTLPQLLPDSISATSLNRLPEHEKLEQTGIHIYTDIVAEELPVDWKNTFDIVLVSVVMQWTEIQKACQEIFRILSPAGFFLGFDMRSIAAKTETEMVQLGMHTVLTEAMRIHWELNGRGHVPFALQKNNTP